MTPKYLLLISVVFCGITATAQIKPNNATAPTLSPIAPQAAYDPNIKINFVRTWEARKAVQDASQQALDNNTNYKTATAYFDGLGRPIQTVVKGNNYDGTLDIVNMNVYDAFGREAQQYLPYAPTTNNNGKFRANAFAEQQAYYQTNYNDQRPISKTEFEASPLNRPTKTMAQGNSWVGSNRGVSVQYGLNTANDDVKIFVIDANGTPILGNYVGSANTIYPNGELVKNSTIDEHGKQAIEFKDKEGKVILKRVQLNNTTNNVYADYINTYYVYDEFGQLAIVIQPEGVKWLSSNAWSFTGTTGNTILAEQCFAYKYDRKGRMVYKKVPGAEASYMCYDKRDRLVFVQDGNLRNPSGGGQVSWLVTFYDALNRPISTALYATVQTQAMLQSSLDAITTANPVPTIVESALTRLTYTDYDEYPTNAQAFNTVAFTTAQNNINPGDEIVDVQVKTECTRGMVTNNKIRILGTNNFINTTTYYDSKNRAIQALSSNINNGTDIASMCYSFTGKVLSNCLKHNNPLASTTVTQNTQVLTRSTYNNDYLLKVEKKINNGNWQQIVQMEYDAMGKPKTKYFGNVADNYKEKYEYNIRGWLTGINKTDQQNLENGIIAPASFYDAIFSQTLSYDYGFSVAGNGYFNGNIAGIKWANANDKQPRSYGYEYDNANRIKVADFTEKIGTDWNTTQGIDYTLNQMLYNANGNILKLKQQGWRIGGSITIDDLTYTYLPNSNKLKGVTDAENDFTSKLGDFKYNTATKTAQDYNYDANGNLVQDKNKDIGSISYNFLNLPKEITKTATSGTGSSGAITYVYDASGNKLQKKTVEALTGGNTKTTTTTYIAGFVYEAVNTSGDVLQFTNHEEGRVRYTKQYLINGDSINIWAFDYFYKDHLGNIRAVVTNQKDTARYRAGFEAGNRAYENALFGKIDETAFPIKYINAELANPSAGNAQCAGCLFDDNYTVDTENGPMPTSYPPDPNAPAPNEYVSRLNGKDKRVGANIVLKVMAGDKIDLATTVWCPRRSFTSYNDANAMEDVFATLLNSLATNTAALSNGKGTVTELSNTNSSPFLPGISTFLNNQPDDDPEGSPKSFLSWILFDEQFKYVPTGSGFIQVPTPDADLHTLVQSITIPKSGYIFVYLSNETEKYDVFFDNFIVQHKRGSLLETTDYSPWGLVLKGISSKGVGVVENKKKYQQYEFNTDFDINLYESFYRSHDPQLGRFWQLDPKPADMESLYAAMGNNPILFSDILGDTAKFDTKTQEMVNKFTTPTTINKKGKEIANKNYNSTFASIIKKIDTQSTKDGYNVNYSFSTGATEGSVTYDGKNINVTIADVGESFGGGADGILFEETKHVEQFLDGKVVFESDSKNPFKSASSTIQNEVEAKQFAIDNLNITKTFRQSGLNIPTQLGVLKSLKNNDLKANFLLKGIKNYIVTGTDNNQNSITGTMNLEAPYPNLPSSIINPASIFTKNSKLFAYPKK